MKRFLTRLARVALALVALVFLARLAFPLPSLDGREVSHFIPPTPQAGLGRLIVPMMARHPGQSGVLTLRRGEDAFAARVVLANAAQHSIDAQYYIWANDSSGVILLDALRRAALRGVRVRLLVDDNGTSQLDDELAALNTLPNFQVRIFNPFTLRSPRAAAYLFDFPRLNRRMHNKSFTVDASATIVGGRNVGDVYFAYGADNLYFDMDVLAVGQAAADVSADFDRYWNSQSAYPAELILGQDTSGLSTLDAAVSRARTDPDRMAYRENVENLQMVRRIADGSLPLEWVRVQMVSDDPAKGLAPVPDDQLLINRLIALLGKVERSLDLISAYFIPGDSLTGYFTDLAGSGRRVRILTNSQEATDVLPVHARYVRYRDPLLAGGVELYELKATQDRGLAGQLGLHISSTNSLHAKVFSVDQNRIFIGSFNFDPRSARLNCEMGFLIESPTLASNMSHSFDTRMKLAAYRVVRTDDGNLNWIETGPNGARVTFTTEPNTPLPARALVTFLGWLPIEWLL